MRFIIDVPVGSTKCADCPFFKSDNVCEYLTENHYCSFLDFAKTHIEPVIDTI